MSTKYDNTDWFRLARTGGTLNVTLDADGVGQGNDGVSLPCKGCFIQIEDGTGAWMMSRYDPDDIGPYIPGASKGCQPIFVQVSDVAKLFFGGDIGGVINIVYLLG